MESTEGSRKPLIEPDICWLLWRSGFTNVLHRHPSRRR